MYHSDHPDKPALVPTGISGLDNILGGGFSPHRLYLIAGNPGSGKTTFAMQMLIEGTRNGEVPLYVTLSETAEELRSSAHSHGLSMDGIEICELVASEDLLEPDAQTTMFHPSEVELSETTRAVLAEVDRVKPTLVVFDSLSEMRLLAQSSLRYRRQILALKQYFIGRECTVFLLDDGTSEAGDMHLQSIAHGVIHLEQLSPEYGAERRRLRVIKMRGRDYRGGYHDFNIVRGGLEVFPRLVAAEHQNGFEYEEVASGLESLDSLLGGGLMRGTSTLLMGPAGSGKSTLMTRYVVTAAERGETCSIFTFEENFTTLQMRSKHLGMDLAPGLSSGKIRIRQIDPAELSPGEFVHRVRHEVENQGAKIVVIDSLNGYLNAMPEERFLIIQLHELLTYLGQKGVLTLLVVAQHGIIANHIETPVDASYLADTVILLRFFEAEGKVRQAISVVKKRSGSHERTIRELTTEKGSLSLGEPLREFRGILSGLPTLVAQGPSLPDREK